MITKYQHSSHVPTEVLAKRLDELSDAVVARMKHDNARFEREFTCRIPVELDRDADVVLSEAALRLSEQDKRIAELEEENKVLTDLLKSTQKRSEQHDLEMQAKGIEDLIVWFEEHCNKWGLAHSLENIAPNYAKKLRKQAKDNQ